MMENQPQQGRQRFSDNFYNSVTYFGVALSVLVLACELFLFGFDLLAPSSSVYLGMFTYILLPPFLILGLILIPLGARWKQHRVLKGLPGGKPIVIDLSLSTHQNAVLIFMVGTAIVLIMTAVGSYKAFHYTESVRFCGALCHEVMKPEYTTYLQSPHARVKCVECHIGEGAGSYVHYKMAGTRMVIKAMQGNYARPIPEPVRDLRPAKETCEQCHWPGKSFSAIELKKTYFTDDPSKTPPWSMNMLMHVGGKKDGSGIHAHMYNDNDIYYVADDEKRQKISWVKSVSRSGEEKIYTTSDSPYKDTTPPAGKVRKMDCMDCHNRPAHRFDAPMPLVNQAMAENKIDPRIPMIKGKAVDVLSKEYRTQRQAVDEIRATLTEYYSKKQPEYYAAHPKEVAQAIDSVVGIYQHYFFPEMKARWDAYPDNIGHMISDGCFRCHDEEHRTQQGTAISRDCTICHTITRQGSADALEKSPDGLDFKHPFEDDGSWKTMNCVDCHSGGS